VRAIAKLPLTATLAMLLAACDRQQETARNPAPPTRPSVRISMEALHRAGGTPPRWKFTPPPGDVAAGRRAFEELGCHSCHTVQGEPFSIVTKTGPELTTMGGHHPPEYFAEAIMNPDAVLVEGPGYIDAQGHSTMPAYPDLTVAQLADLVAYIGSLTVERLGVQPAAGMHDHGAMGGPPPVELPAPPAGDASSFLVQTYEVHDGKLRQLEAWFQQEAASRFRGHDGLLTIDTWIDSTGERPLLTTVFGFRSDVAREGFVNDPSISGLLARFAEFGTAKPLRSYRRPPFYRAFTLSAP
jgi:mono/diheme cytochrome c family protein